MTDRSTFWVSDTVTGPFFIWLFRTTFWQTSAVVFSKLSIMYPIKVQLCLKAFDSLKIFDFNWQVECVAKFRFTSVCYVWESLCYVIGFYIIYYVSVSKKQRTVKMSITEWALWYLKNYVPPKLGFSVIRTALTKNAFYDWKMLSTATFLFFPVSKLQC